MLKKRVLRHNNKACQTFVTTGRNAANRQADEEERYMWVVQDGLRRMGGL